MIRASEKYNIQKGLQVYLFFSRTKLYNFMLGQWALLAYIVITLPNPNKVEETPKRVEACPLRRTQDTICISQTPKKIQYP